MSTEYLYQTLELYIGITLEVQTEDEKRLLLGKVKDIEEEQICLEDYNGNEMPPVMEHAAVILRGLGRGGRILTISGKVTGIEKFQWCIGQLRIVAFDNKRGTFRQQISGTATVTRLSSKDDPNTIPDPANTEKGVDGELLNISATGLCFRGKENYDVGDWLRLSNIHIITEELFTFICQIKWTKESPNGIMYGCQFQELDMQTQNRLFKEIFLAQKQEMKKRRDRSWN